MRIQRPCGTLHRAALIAVAALGVAPPKSALAQPVADFYRGKQLKMIIRAAPGGNYDLYLRLLARHIVRHIPGNPTAVPDEHAGRRRAHRAQLFRQGRARMTAPRSPW